jgi:glycosyltransferase involved in cell wall biosynthesis
MKVLALASYPIEAAATRYRLEQFVEPLAARGITLSIHPFLDPKLFQRLYQRGSLPGKALGLLKSALFRLGDLPAARQADVLLIQREAMLFGPPLVEWLITRVLKRPMVLDLDDATYVSYTSPTYGGVGTALKWAGKTDDLIKWAAIVTCGNRSIAEYVSSKGASARIIPTVVDTDVFRPVPRPHGSPVVLGWIGTHSTFPYLESIFPVLSKLASQYSFRLKIVGSGRETVAVPGVEVENFPWKLEREVEDFRSMDIGLYPIDSSLYAGRWAAGKSGFKGIQYMAVGVPYVATPVGGSAEIGVAGTTHLFATTNEEWHLGLETLLRDEDQRREMGAAGRRHGVEHYGLQAQADKLADALRAAAN